MKTGKEWEHFWDQKLVCYLYKHAFLSFVVWSSDKFRAFEIIIFRKNQKVPLSGALIIFCVISENIA